MKPKKKSNVIYMTLLFLLVLMQYGSLTCSDYLPGKVYSFHPSCSNDTIIIDGEAIYIEKEMVSTDLDSMQERAIQDVRNKPVPKHLWMIGLFSGVNTTMASYKSSLTDMTPLDVFVTNDRTAQANFYLGAEAGVRVLRIPAGNGQLDLSVTTGASWNQIKVSSTALTNENQFVQDSIIGLRYDSGELLLDYFDVFAPPNIGELDTVNLDYTKNITSCSTLDIPVSLRFSYSARKARTRLYGEAGVVRRVLIGIPEKHDNFLVNGNGEYIKLKSDEFAPRSLIRPMFAIGIERKIDTNSEDSGKFMTWGCQINATIPPAAFNSGSLYVMNISTFSFSLFLRGYF